MRVGNVLNLSSPRQLRLPHIQCNLLKCQEMRLTVLSIQASQNESGSKAFKKGSVIHNTTVYVIEALGEKGTIGMVSCYDDGGHRRAAGRERCLDIRGRSSVSSSCDILVSMYLYVKISPCSVDE